MAVALACLLAAMSGAASAASDSVPDATAGTEVRLVSWDAQLQDAVRVLLDATAKPLTGRRLTREQAQAAVDGLSGQLRAGGWPVALALLTQDDWNHFSETGELHIRVFEGDVGQVRVSRHERDGASTGGASDERLIATAEHALCGNAGLPCVLTRTGLERAQLLLRDLPGVQINAIDLSPEGVGLGQTAVVLDVAPAGPGVKGSVSADNYGAPSSGRYRLGGNLVLTNLMHQTDVVQLALMHAQHQTTGSAGLSVPVGADGWRAKLDAERSNFSLNQVAATGTADSLDGSLTYPIVRGLDLDTSAEVGAFATQSHQDVAGQAAFAPRHIEGFRQTLSADAGARAMDGGGDIWSASTTLTEGRVRQHLGGVDSTGVLGVYDKLTGGLLLRRDLAAGNWYMLGSLRGQIASRNLDGSERMGVGGVNGVRAYRVDEGQVDEGVLASLELRQRIGLADHDQVTPGVFVDALAGHIVARPYGGWQTQQGFADPGLSNTRHLSGWGLGLDWVSHLGFNGGMSVAWKFAGSPDSINYPGSAKARLLATLGWDL